MQANKRNDAFQALNMGRIVVWGLFALVLLVAPRVFTSSLSITMLSQMGIAIIACLSYNMLMGQGGMLSFGHAVYTGLGSYMAIHALHGAGAGTWPIPVSLIPLVGGLAGMGFAALLGYVTTRKSGTTFAMITLGMAELVFAMSLMFSEFFGGEGGCVGQPCGGPAFLGHHLWACRAGLLPDCGLHLGGSGRHVCLHRHAAGPRAQRRA